MDLGLWDPAQIWQLQLIIWSIKVWCRCQSMSTEAVTQKDGVWLDRIFFWLLNAQHHQGKRYYLEIFRPNSRYVLHSGGISLCALPLTSTQVFGSGGTLVIQQISTVLGANKAILISRIVTQQLNVPQSMTRSLRQDLGAVTVTNGFGLPQPAENVAAENVAQLIHADPVGSRWIANKKTVGSLLVHDSSKSRPPGVVLAGRCFST